MKQGTIVAIVPWDSAQIQIGGPTVSYFNTRIDWFATPGAGAGAGAGSGTGGLTVSFGVGAPSVVGAAHEAAAAGALQLGAAGAEQVGCWQQT